MIRKVMCRQVAIGSKRPGLRCSLVQANPEDEIAYSCLRARADERGLSIALPDARMFATACWYDRLVPGIADGTHHCPPPLASLRSDVAMRRGAGGAGERLLAGDLGATEKRADADEVGVPGG
jgi:hypothetical protein